jgi:hypothetical protein
VGVQTLRAQADWTFTLPSELPTKELHHLPRKMPPQAYRTCQDVVPPGGIFLGKWRCTFAGSSEVKMNVKSACALNTLYKTILYLFLHACETLYLAVREIIQIEGAGE